MIVCGNESDWKSRILPTTSGLLNSFLFLFYFREKKFNFCYVRTNCLFVEKDSHCIRLCILSASFPFCLGWRRCWWCCRWHIWFYDLDNYQYLSAFITLLSTLLPTPPSIQPDHWNTFKWLFLVLLFVCSSYLHWINLVLRRAGGLEVGLWGGVNHHHLFIRSILVKYAGHTFSRITTSNCISSLWWGVFG